MLDFAVLALALAAAAATLAAYAATGVAPLTSPRAARRAALELLLPHAPALAGRTVFELGCGAGALLVEVAAALPESRVVGIEISPIPWAIARIRARGRPNVEVRFGDFFREPLDGAGACLCYLMRRPMRRLAEKLDRELAAGTPVIALGFLFHGRRTEEARWVPAVFPMEVARYRW